MFDIFVNGKLFREMLSAHDTVKVVHALYENGRKDVVIKDFWGEEVKLNSQMKLW